MSEVEVRELKTQITRIQSENRGMGAKMASQKEQSKTATVAVHTRTLYMYHVHVHVCMYNIHIVHVNVYKTLAKKEEKGNPPTQIHV